MRLISIVGLFNIIIYTTVWAASPQDMAHSVQDDESLEMPIVSILSWANLIQSDAVVNQIEAACNVTLAIDAYRSNVEYIRRINRNRLLYDISIFSEINLNPAYNVLTDDDAPDLSDVAKNYHPVVKAYYDELDLPQNILFFLHSMTGFLWRPDNVEVTAEKTVHQIASESSDKIILLTNDPFKVFRIINNENDIKSDYITKFNHFVSGNERVYFNNHLENIHNDEDFAFAFLWSGYGLLMADKYDQYEFMVHPSHPELSSALIAAHNDEPEVVCVARLLASADIIYQIFKDRPYLSPYTLHKSIIAPHHKAFYEAHIDLLEEPSWTMPPRKNRFWGYNHSWEVIRYTYRQ